MDGFQAQANQVVAQPSFTQKITGFLEKRPVILQLVRFGAIGVFNTAIDVLVLNFLAAKFGVTKGAAVGWVNLPGFVLAVVQSYFWNKYWAFGTGEAGNLVKTFFRLCGVGFVGVVTYGLTALGGHESAGPLYFLGIFIVFVLAQIALWYSFGLFNLQSNGSKPVYIQFFIVSIIGFVINSTILYLATTHFILSTNSGDNLNIGKILATFASLIWNFIGYKLFVFKK